MTQRRKFWMRWRVRFGYLVAVIYIVLVTPTPHSIVIGGMVAAFGLFIRGAAAGHLRKGRELATTGPYAHVRNPLYLGSALLGAGFVVAGNSWWVAGVVIAYFVIFYPAVMHNEEEDLRASFGQALEEYAERVPLFFPKLIGKGYEPPTGEGPARSFSWEQYRQNREYRALLGMVAGLVGVWLRMLLRTRCGC